MSYNYKENNVTDDLNDKMMRYQSISFRINFVVDIVIVLASLSVFIIVLYRRRRETFILAIPFLFLWYGALSILNYTYILGWDGNRIEFLNTKFG